MPILPERATTNVAPSFRGRHMRFLVKSAFWLGVVYSSAPFGGAEALRSAGRNIGGATRAAGEALVAACLQGERPACDELRLAACVMATTSAAQGCLGTAQEPKRQEKKPPVETLTALDRLRPWRAPPHQRS